MAPTLYAKRSRRDSGWVVSPRPTHNPGTLRLPILREWRSLHSRLAAARSFFSSRAWIHSSFFILLHWLFAGRGGIIREVWISEKSAAIEEAVCCGDVTELEDKVGVLEVEA